MKRIRDYDADTVESYVGGQTPLGLGVKILIGFFVLAVLGVGCSVIMAPIWWMDRAVAVTKQEIDPAVLLKRYQWFKDAAAQLDGQNATISAFEARRQETIATYGPAGSWPRDVREELALQSATVAGVRAAYNQLAAEYNAAMAKMNWRFTNRGMVPEGGEPLPREYRPYETGGLQ